MTTIYRLQKYDGSREIEAYFDPSEGGFYKYPEREDGRQIGIPPWKVGSYWTILETMSLEDYLGASDQPGGPDRIEVGTSFREADLEAMKQGRTVESTEYDPESETSVTIRLSFPDGQIAENGGNPE